MSIFTSYNTHQPNYYAGVNDLNLSGGKAELLRSLSPSQKY